MPKLVAWLPGGDWAVLEDGFSVDIVQVDDGDFDDMDAALCEGRFTDIGSVSVSERDGEMFAEWKR